jgi:hypothetical protein
LPLSALGALRRFQSGVIAFTKSLPWNWPRTTLRSIAPPGDRYAMRSGMTPEQFKQEEILPLLDGLT